MRALLILVFLIALFCLGLGMVISGASQETSLTWSEDLPKDPESIKEQVEDVWTRVRSGEASTTETVVFYFCAAFLSLVMLLVAGAVLGGLLIFALLTREICKQPKSEKDSKKEESILFKVSPCVGFLLFGVVPFCAACMGVWGAKFGQGILRETDMEGLRTRLEDDLWFYNTLEWFRNIEIGALEGFLVWLLVFLLSSFVILILYGIVEGHVQHDREQKRLKAQKPVYRSPSYEGSGGNYGGSSYEGSPGPGKTESQPASNPLAPGAHGHKPWLASSERSLSNYSYGPQTGSISEKEMITGDQIVRDSSGQEVEKISGGLPDGLPDDWHVDTDWHGFGRVIKDGKGDIVADFETNPLTGQTEVKKRE